MRVTVHAPITHLCPHVEERDLGTIEASWSGDTVELHNFAVTLRAFADVRVTHEELTGRVAAWLREVAGRDAEVVTRWQTAGFDVECRA